MRRLRPTTTCTNSHLFTQFETCKSLYVYALIIYASLQHVRQCCSAELYFCTGRGKGGCVFNICIYKYMHTYLYECVDLKCVRARQQLPIYKRLSWLLLASCASHTPPLRQQQQHTNTYSSSSGGDSSIAFHFNSCQCISL